MPIVVTTYGKVGDAAAELFVGLEQAARRDKTRFATQRLGWLARTVTAAAVHGAARQVLDAFAPPDGQERAGAAHRAGREGQRGGHAAARAARAAERDA